MNPLSKLIISVCAQCDCSWHHLSFWAIGGLNHCVIKCCPCSSTEVGLECPCPSWGRWNPPDVCALSLLVLPKHSSCVCPVPGVAQTPQMCVPCPWGCSNTPDVCALSLLGLFKDSRCACPVLGVSQTLQMCMPCPSWGCSNMPDVCAQ